MDMTEQIKIQNLERLADLGLLVEGDVINLREITDRGKWTPVPGEIRSRPAMVLTNYMEDIELVVNRVEPYEIEKLRIVVFNVPKSPNCFSIYEGDLVLRELPGLLSWGRILSKEDCGYDSIKSQLSERGLV